MKKILLLSTGGTIASERGEDGLVPAVDGAFMVRLIPGLAGMCEITCSEIFSIDSSNMQPRHWSVIAEAIAESYDKYDGFVVTHGTDTMAYTSSALSFMLKNLNKPVVLTGAQLPIEAPGTDGKRNLFNSFKVACSGHSGVHIVFGDYVINGSCAKKIHTREFNAFRSINKPAEAGITENEILWTTSPVSVKERFEAMPELDEKVILVKLTPGISPAIIDYAVKSGCRGIVIEGFGMGGIPNEENNFLPAIEKAVKSGIIVVAATQCVYGGVDLGEYEVGITAARDGVVPAGEMTTEAALTKLMWALGNAENAESAKKLFSE